MATQTIFDPTTQNTRSITILMQSGLVEQDEDAELDFFLRMTSGATRKDGNPVPVQTIRTLWDMVIGGVGGTKLGGGAGPYSDLTEAVEDYILYMVEGDGVDPDTAMDFTD